MAVHGASGRSACSGNCVADGLRRPTWRPCGPTCSCRGRPSAGLIFDDLHWSDDATLELLGPLVEAVASDPVAIVGAYRSDELPRAHLLRPLRARLRHQRQVVEVELGPLRVTGVAELVTALLRRPADS